MATASTGAADFAADARGVVICAVVVCNGSGADICTDVIRVIQGTDSGAGSDAAGCGSSGGGDARNQLLTYPDSGFGCLQACTYSSSWKLDGTISGCRMLIQGHQVLDVISQSLQKYSH